MNDVFFFWLVGALVFLVIELSSPGLFLFLSFSFGAFAGALANWFDFIFIGQMLLAFFVTSLALVVLTFVVKKHEQFKQSRSHRSNVYALLGKCGFVIKKINAGGMGQVKIGGEIWTARTLKDEVIDEGQEICVLNVSGAHLVVQKVLKQFDKKD